MKVSILYHVYNNYQDLSESIESILNQTNKNFELILILDAPSEQVLEVIDQFNLLKDKRVKVIKFMENFGRSFTYNFALNKATGDYIYFTEARAILQPNFVEELTTLIKSNNSKYDFINFIVNSDSNSSAKESYEFTKNTEEEIYNIVNIKLSLKDKVFKRKFLLDNKIEFTQYKNFYSLYLYEVLESFKYAYFFNKNLSLWKREIRNGYEYNLYNILESAEKLCEILMKKGDEEAEKVDAYLTWIPISILYEFVKKMYHTYYNNEKIVAKSIANAADLIDRIYPNYKKNNKLSFLQKKWILSYLLDFKRNVSFVRKNLK